MTSSSSSSSTSRSWSYDVFPSFRGEDVRKSFLSYLLKELHRKSIHTFIDNGIERSRPIAPELLLAIEESKTAIVVFSKNYASSTWCLNELVKIHECCTKSGQMGIPIFYDVDPSHVRKQTGEFGKAFDETCHGKTEDEIERWKQALVALANIAGYDLQNWDNEGDMTEKIAIDVSNKLNSITPVDDLRDYVGIEAHLEKLNPLLCLESGEVRMVGIVGISGIGKSTIGRALYNQLSSQFELRSFKAYKRSTQDRKTSDISVKLSWVKQFLSDILGQNDVKIDSLSVVEQRLKHKKVLIVLDDVDERAILETLVGQTRWFGCGSRIVVVTQDREILKSHQIDLIYDVELPCGFLAFEMFSRSAFRHCSPPEAFLELSDEVVELSGNLPLALTVLGSALREKNKEEWMKMLPRLRDGLHDEIEKTLRVSYEGLGHRDQDIFLYIACLFNGKKVNYIENMLGKDVLRILAYRSLISISSSTKTVEMHSLLEKLGREIVRAESSRPGKRRILLDAEDVSDVFTNHTGTETVVGIRLDLDLIKEPLSLTEKSFKGMHNLQFLQILNGCDEVKIYLPQGHIGYWPHKLRVLHWDNYPAKSLPSSFTAVYLVELIMKGSKLEKLWEGTQPLRSLKKMILRSSTDFKQVPDLSNAINLEELDFCECTSLVELPSTIRNLNKLADLNMDGCSHLEVLPTDISLESLDRLGLEECSQLTTFPRISRNISELQLDGIAMEEEDCLWIGNYSRLKDLSWINCPLRWMPSDFNPEHLVEIYMRDSKLERLWEGVQSLRNLLKMNLSRSKNLKEIPDLSKATNLTKLHLSGCSSLVKLPSSVQHLDKLEELDMEECTSLEVLPTNVDLASLTTLILRGCSRLKIFPQISTSIKRLYLDETAIDEVPSWIENMADLEEVLMRRCEKLRKISANVKELRHLSSFEIETPHVSTPELLLARGAHAFILQSYLNYEVLPGEEVPLYFTHQTSGASLSVPLPQSSLSGKKLEFAGCIILDLGTDYQYNHSTFIVHWKFRGVTGIRKIKPVTYSSEMDCQVVFHFDIDNGDEMDDPSSQLDSSSVEFEFEHHKLYFCNCYSIFNVKRRNLQTCPIFPQKIKGCGIRVMSVSSLNADGTTSETEYNHMSREELVAEIKSSKMTVVTPQEPSNTLCGQTAAPDLEISLGICGTSAAHVSARGKVPSSSISLRSIHGDSSSLSLSLTPCDPFPVGEYVYSCPMITEEQDAETDLLDPLSSPQLINFFSQSLVPNSESMLHQEIAGSDFEASIKKRGLEVGALGPTSFKKLRRAKSF